MVRTTMSTDLVAKVFCKTTMAVTYCITTMVSISNQPCLLALMHETVPTYISYLDEDKRLGWDYIEYIEGWPVLVY